MFSRSALRGSTLKRKCIQTRNDPFLSCNRQTTVLSCVKIKLQTIIDKQTQYGYDIPITTKHTLNFGQHKREKLWLSLAQKLTSDNETRAFQTIVQYNDDISRVGLQIFILRQ